MGKNVHLGKRAEQLDDFKDLSASIQAALLSLIEHNTNEAEHLATQTDPNCSLTIALLPHCMSTKALS